jgi:hypothetical protein
VFNRPFYTTLLIFTALFFLFQKSNAGINVVARSHYNIPQTFSKANDRVAQQIVNDILTNSNDEDSDDETSSKTKHRLPKITMPHDSKFNSARLLVSSLIRFNSSLFSGSANRSRFAAFLFYKTSISIAIRCLRL